MERLNAYRKFPTLKELFISKVPITNFGCLTKIWLNRKYLSLIENNKSHYVFNIKGTFFYILKLGLNNISAGTVDYTGGEDRRPNLLKGRSSVKSEAHKSLVCG